MDGFFYAIGVTAVAALIIYSIQEFEKRKPIRTLDDNPKRYYCEMEYILRDFVKDATVKEFLLAAAEDLGTSYKCYKATRNDEHLNAIFGGGSFGKRREEALALCYLISWHSSPIIDKMKPGFKKRFLELRNDTNICPPELYEPFRDIQSLISSSEFDKKRNALKQSITEQLSRSRKMRELFPSYTIEQVVDLFCKYSSDINIYSTEDVSADSVRKALMVISEKISNEN